MQSRKPSRTQDALKLAALITVVASIASGCALLTFRVRGALNIPEEKLAVVEEASSGGFFFLIGFSGGHRVRVGQVDDEEVGAMSRTFQILPGQHVIKAQLAHETLMIGWSEFSCYRESVLRFEAQEGKHYIVDARRESKPVQLRIKEKETGAVVGNASCQRLSWARC